MVALTFPTARVPERLVETEKRRSWEEVAQSLGFEPTELVRAQLLEFFEDESLKLYDYSRVSAWLTKKKEATGAEYWCWRPLRKKDIITDYRWGWTGTTGRVDGYYYEPECLPYDRLVPLHALEKVMKIETSFGDKVKFFVSDYPDRNPDPFIMVRPTTKDSSKNGELCFIFDAWDEPGFGISS